VTSGVSGTRTDISSVAVARGVFDGVGRIVEIPARPGDPPNVSRDDLVYPEGTMHLVNTAAGFSSRIASAIVGTGGAAVRIQLGEPLASWVLDPDLDKYRKMDPRVIVGAALDTIAAGCRTTSARTTWPATTAAAWDGESDG
jgi:hypothetical protein